MIELLLGAAAAGWVVSKVLGSAEARRLDFPFVPHEWWTPRDRLFTVKDQAFYRLGQRAQINAMYREYGGAHPDDGFAKLVLTMAAGNEGRWEESLEHARRMVEAEPNISVGYWRVAIAARKLGDDLSAVKAWKKFVELEPDSRMVPHIRTLLTRLEAHGVKAPEKKEKKPAKKKAKAPAEKAAPPDDKRERLEKLKARARKLRAP